MTIALDTPPEIMNSPHTEDAWENDLASLLEDLTQVQDDLLDVLAQKRQCMATGDRHRMTQLQGVEQQLCQRLQACCERRSELLAGASQQGLPVDSLDDLAKVLSGQGASDPARQCGGASARMGLLQHNCLANWVLAQKALLHASQMLDIIASGGRLQPTYGNRTRATAGGAVAGGALVDQEA